MGKVRKITIRDVADAAEVSPATVSMVLNNSERSFSDDVRKRVLHAVKKLKYTPVGVGRPCIGSFKNSNNSSKPKVAMLVDAPHFSINESVYGMVHKGAEFELRLHKIDLIVQNIDSYMLPADVSGVIHFKTYGKNKDKLIGNRAAIICMGTIDRDSRSDHVTYNNADISIKAAKYLLGKGHKHIGFMPMDNSEIFSERSEVFQRLIIKSGTKCSYTTPTDHANLFDNPANLEKVLREYLNRPDRPTALFIPADTVTSIAYPLLYSIGVIPGKDIEIVTCNNEFLRLAGLTPRPTVIDIKSFDIGRFAATQLLNRIRHPSSAPVQMELIPDLIEGSHWDKYIKESFYYR